MDMKKSFVDDKIKSQEQKEKMYKMKKEKMQKNAVKRYNHKVEYEKYKTGNIIKLICAVIAIIIIPL